MPNLLFPEIDPYDTDFLPVSGGHRIYYEQCGAVKGIPIVYLHGGPGSCVHPKHRRIFDPKAHRVILFDQRGCGRSEPHASVSNNRTADLVADLERLRRHLGIEAWWLFGGSWGSTLALCYALEHSRHVLGMLLRGVFTLRRQELDWFYNGGVRRFRPELYDAFVRAIPGTGTDNIARYHQAIFGPDPGLARTAEAAWTKWELANGAERDNSDRLQKLTDRRFVSAFARIEVHYFQNGAFLPTDGYVLSECHRLAGIPTTIIQGENDMICPPDTAWDLAARIPGARHITANAAGHDLWEPGILTALRAALDDIR